MTIADSLTEPQLAARWKISRRTLQRWRALRRGPAYRRIGRITYTIADVEAYERASRVATTAVAEGDPAGAGPTCQPVGAAP